MARKIDAKIRQVLARYIDAVRKDHEISGAFLFGSYANGAEKFESDIDIAILLDNIENKFDTRVVLSSYSWGIDTRIEPHPIRTEDYENSSTMLAMEVKRTGIKIA